MAIDQAANAAVRREIERAIAERGEVGVQVAAYLHGELVIDCWAGIADRESGTAVDGDTLFNVFSVAKAIPATCIHLQAEKGLLDYDAPIARYWPEWGCHGKERATVRDALTHLTGTPQMPPGVNADTIGDWDFVVAGIAALEPMYPVGEVPAYQAGIYGWVLGEIVRRTDPRHRSFQQYVREELAMPLGADDLWIGLPDHVLPRVARLVDDAKGPPFPDDLPLARAVPNHLMLNADIYEDPRIRRACIAATGGIFTARSVARLFGMLANGGEIDGVRLLSKDRIDAACEPRPNSLPDPIMFGTVLPMSQGGYWLHDAGVPTNAPATGARTISVPGHGGSLAWGDPDTGLAVAFCHNRMSNNMTAEEHPAWDIANVVRECLGLDAKQPA